MKVGDYVKCMDVIYPGYTGENIHYDDWAVMPGKPFQIAHIREFHGRAFACLIGAPYSSIDRYDMPFGFNRAWWWPLSHFELVRNEKHFAELF